MMREVDNIIVNFIQLFIFSISGVSMLSRNQNLEEKGYLLTFMDLG